VLASLLRLVFWLVLIFPLLLGAAVGAVAGLGARLGKFRSPRQVGQLGLVAGLLAVFAMHYFDYVRLGWQVPGLNQVTFVEYMQARARFGVKIGKPGAANGGMNLGYTGSFIYWAVEAGLSALAAYAVSQSMVSTPFCAGCNRWKAKRALGPYRLEPQTALAAFTAGVPAGIVAPAQGNKKVSLVIHHCPDCGAATPIDVQLSATEPAGKEQVMYQSFLTYPGEATAAFDDLDRACREQGLYRGKQ
jgi:hypothetical protein